MAGSMPLEDHYSLLWGVLPNAVTSKITLAVSQNIKTEKKNE